MLKMLQKVFWFIVYALLIAVLFLALRFFSVWMDWPAWTSLAGTIVFVVLYLLLRKARAYLRRRREEKLAAQVLETDEKTSEPVETDPELEARMNLTWKNGLNFLAKSRLGKFNFAYKLPWYLMIGDDDQARAKALDEISVHGTDINRDISDPEFQWRFGKNAVWLDLPFGENEDSGERWRFFLADLIRNRGKAPLGGVVVLLEARRLIESPDEELKRQAAVIRGNLDSLIKISGNRIPVYVLVNGIDEIYGVHAIVSRLGSDAVANPLGLFRSDGRETPGAFASRVPIDMARALLAALRREEVSNPLSRIKSNDMAIAPGEAASFQAGDEMPRLSAPLSLFCSEAFSENPYQMVPFLRGIFLGASRHSPQRIPSLLTSIASFIPESEDQIEKNDANWFFSNLLAEWIPQDPAPSRPVRQRRHMRAITVHSGLAALLIGTLLLAWAMAASFFEARGVLAAFVYSSQPNANGLETLFQSKNQASTPAQPVPDSAEIQQRWQELTSEAQAANDDDDKAGDGDQTAAANKARLGTTSLFPTNDLDVINDLLDVAMRIELRNRRWMLPRFGMREPLVLSEKLQDIYCDLYFRQVLLPGINNVKESASSAALSGTPADIGNNLFLLSTFRQGFADRLAGKNAMNNFDSLYSLVETLTSPGDSMAKTRMEMFLHWTDNKDWMQAASEEFLALERQVIMTARNGQVMEWLPQWVDGLPGINPISTASVWAPVAIPANLSDKRIVKGCWTAQGYARAQQLLNTILFDNDQQQIWGAQREALLAQYRAQALAAWRSAVFEIWRDYQANINDNDLSTLIKQIAAGNGPAERMLNLLAQHLVPMYDGDDSVPDIEWLRLYRQLRLSSTGLAGAAEQSQSFLSKVAGEFSQLVEKINSNDNIALLSRNIGFSSGSDTLTALDNLNELNKAYADISFLTGSRDSCINLIRSQFLHTSANYSLTASANADKAQQSAAGDASQDPQLANISANPFGDGKSASSELNSFLMTQSGSSTWLVISPKATYNYLRYLATRQAAVHVNAIRYENVFNPALVTSGTDEEVLDALFAQGGIVNTFLNTTCRGFWTMANDKMANAVWDELPFMFSKRFLDFCDIGIANTSVKIPEKISITLNINAVSVDSSARERPYQLDFTWSEQNDSQTLVYRNYQTGKVFDWNMDQAATASITIYFPSLTLVKQFSGNKALKEFIDFLDRGTATLRPDDFPGQAEILKRLGVTQIDFKATMVNQRQLLQYLDIETPTLIANIITRPYDGKDASAHTGQQMTNGQASYQGTGAQPAAANQRTAVVNGGSGEAQK